MAKTNGTVAKPRTHRAKPAASELATKIWLTLPEAVTLYGYSESTFYHWLSDGTLGKHNGAYRRKRWEHWRINRVEFEEKFLKREDKLDEEE